MVGFRCFLFLISSYGASALLSRYGCRVRPPPSFSQSNRAIINPEAEAIAESSETERRRVAVLVCPAQFCVPEDYETLFDNLSVCQDKLNVDIASSSTAVPLGRTDWIKVARQLPTRAFLEARLDVKQTLDWYFQAIEDGLAQIFETEGPEVDICIVGHSIGGWVARAYLGGMSLSSSAVYQLAMEKCTSLVTLGTPHLSPDNALVDQTRGLLRAISETPSCSPKFLKEEKEISITCVCSEGVPGSLELDAEKLIAVGSYVPLTGSFEGVNGDGIVPTSLAFLDEPARRVLLDKCDESGEPIRHIHVLPTPWNLWNPKAPSIELPEQYPSYVSKGVVQQWARFIK